MSNKFLGLDSINVITDYINKYIDHKQQGNQYITLQLYKYYTSEEDINRPTGISYDFLLNIIKGIDNDGLTNTWNTLDKVVSYITETYTTLEEALSNGSIYMSSASIIGKNDPKWSYPIKISGQNGEPGVEFAYSYKQNPTNDEISYSPLNIDSTNKYVYFWVKPAGENWPVEFKDGKIWAIFAEDGNSGKEVRMQYCTTHCEYVENDIPKKPKYEYLLSDKINNVFAQSEWHNTIIDTNLTKEYPYLWVRTQTIVAGDYANADGWSDPILLSVYGKDGNVPDYTITLFRKGYFNGEISDINGIVKPKLNFITINDEPVTIDEYIGVDDWVELPEDDAEIIVDEQPTEDIAIWWQCTIKVDGRTNKVISQDSIGSVKRYSAIDGTAKPGQFTLNLYAWSENQLQPEMSETLVDEWRPENYYYLPDKPLTLTSPEASLWMITANVTKIDEDGKPVVNGSWSEPVKLTGPRGPIAYDYRIERYYKQGTEDKPIDGDWIHYNDETQIPINTKYPYVWVADVLVAYKMDYIYDENNNPIINEDGSYKTEPVGDGSLIKTLGYYRASGKDGENGNKRNSLIYNTTNETIMIDGFSTNNLFVSNSENNTTYNINISEVDAALNDLSGYTGKFSNIGSGKMIITTTEKFPFVTGNNEFNEIILDQYENIEIVCYKIEETLKLLILGKLNCFDTI